MALQKAIPRMRIVEFSENLFHPLNYKRADFFLLNFKLKKYTMKDSFIKVITAA